MSAAGKSKKFQFLPFLISILITLAIGVVAMLFTRPQIPGWYATLHKPWFNPPRQLFAPVWTCLYIMMAIAAYLVWKQRSRKPVYKIARGIYFMQLVLNFSWSIVFFGAHQVFAAVVIIAALWLAIIFNINWFVKFNKTAGWLLVPYLLWVSFAAALNVSIYLLNR